MKTERRMKVRVQPRDLPLEFHVREGVASEQVIVSNIGVGGMGLFAEKMIGGKTVGRRLQGKLDLGTFGTYEVTVEIRYALRTGAMGVQFIEPSAQLSDGVGRYVAEALERGSAV